MQTERNCGILLEGWYQKPSSRIAYDDALHANKGARRIDEMELAKMDHAFIYDRNARDRPLYRLWQSGNGERVGCVGNDASAMATGSAWLLARFFMC